MSKPIVVLRRDVVRAKAKAILREVIHSLGDSNDPIAAAEALIVAALAAGAVSTHLMALSGAVIDDDSEPLLDAIVDDVSDSILDEQDPATKAILNRHIQLARANAPAEAMPQ